VLVGVNEGVLVVVCVRVGVPEAVNTAFACCVFVGVPDGVVVGVEIGVFVRVEVSKLVDEDVSTETGEAIESVASVGVFEKITVGLVVGVSRMRGGVGNGWAVSSGVAGMVKNGIGTTGNSYWSMVVSPKIAR